MDTVLRGVLRVARHWSSTKFFHKPCPTSVDPNGAVFYDSMGGRKVLPDTRVVNLKEDEVDWLEQCISKKKDHRFDIDVS